ncbi:MAG: hypothetical protein ACJA17_000105 [Polaribacter sp.]
MNRIYIQISPPDVFASLTESNFDIQWFVILGLAAAVFTLIKVAEFLSKMKVSPKVKKLNYTSQELNFY